MALPDIFSLVTVMDVEVQTLAGVEIVTDNVPASTITCLTMSNITMEGPRKEARGGRNAEPCVRYGKTMRIEMEDVVARLSLFEHLFGVDTTTVADEYAFTNKFAVPVKLVGTTDIVNENGVKTQVTLTIPNFLPDSVSNFTMESEGDIGMINIAGECFPDSTSELFYTIEVI